MRNKRIFLIFFTVLVILAATIVSVSAQDIDVDSMDNEQLTALLLQILGKLQQDETPAAETDPDISETPASTAEPVPAADLEAIEEIIQITIYDDKKLIIEKLPEYMFIQPTKPAKPEKPETPNKTNNNNDNHGTDDSHGFVWDNDGEYCLPPYHWECDSDGCVCASPNG